MNAFIIAEAGSCHDGKLDQALELIRVARAAGADACKFQFWSSADRLAERRHAPNYLEIYRRYQMPADWLPALHEACAAAGIEFMATTYLPEDVATVAPYVQRFKIASFEAEDLTLLYAHEPFAGKTILVSTGMLDDAAVDALGRLAHRRGLHFNFMLCTSAYPTPLEQIGLRVLKHSRFVGFSDHSRSVIAGAVAVAVTQDDAIYIEKHFCVEETDPENPDMMVALPPGDLGAYVANVREAELLLRASSRKRVQPAESAMLPYKVPAATA